MDTQTLANEAFAAIKVIDSFEWQDQHIHGIEVTPGFFNVYNETTGQSKTVVFHPESGLLFKRTFWGQWASEAVKASNRHLGEIEVDYVTYPVRLPYFEFVQMLDERETFIEIQEFIYGESCSCDDYAYCAHRGELRTLTGYLDCHRGNWKITPEGEIVLFDFDGMRLD